MSIWCYFHILRFFVFEHELPHLDSALFDIILHLEVTRRPLLTFHVLLISEYYFAQFFHMFLHTETREVGTRMLVNQRVIDSSFLLDLHQPLKAIGA